MMAWLVSIVIFFAFATSSFAAGVSVSGGVSLSGNVLASPGGAAADINISDPAAGADSLLVEGASFTLPSGEFVVADDCVGYCNEGSLQISAPGVWCPSSSVCRMFFAYMQGTTDLTGCAFRVAQHDFVTDTTTYANVAVLPGTCEGNASHNAADVTVDNDGYLDVWYGETYCAQVGPIDGSTPNRGVCHKKSVAVGTIASGFGAESSAPFGGVIGGSGFGTRWGGVGKYYDENNTIYLTDQISSAALGFASRTSGGSWVGMHDLVRTPNGNNQGTPANFFSFGLKSSTEMHLVFSASNISSCGRGITHIYSTDGGVNWKDRKGGNSFTAATGLDGSEVADACYPEGAGPPSFATAYQVDPVTQRSDFLALDFLADGRPILMTSDGTNIKLKVLSDLGTASAAWSTVQTFSSVNPHPQSALLKVMPGSGDVVVLYAASGADFTMRVSTDNGASFDAGTTVAIDRTGSPTLFAFTARAFTPPGRAELLVLSYTRSFGSGTPWPTASHGEMVARFIEM